MVKNFSSSIFLISLFFLFTFCFLPTFVSAVNCFPDVTATYSKTESTQVITFACGALEPANCSIAEVTFFDSKHKPVSGTIYNSPSTNPTFFSFSYLVELETPNNYEINLVDSVGCSKTIVVFIEGEKSTSSASIVPDSNLFVALLVLLSAIVFSTKKFAK